MVEVRFHARAAVARCHIEVSLRRMGPRVLYNRRHLYRFALDEAGSIDIDVVVGQLVAYGAE
jgi:hypothetical protein